MCRWLCNPYRVMVKPYLQLRTLSHTRQTKASVLASKLQKAKMRVSWKQRCCVRINIDALHFYFPLFNRRTCIYSLVASTTDRDLFFFHSFIPVQWLVILNRRGFKENETCTLRETECVITRGVSIRRPVSVPLKLLKGLFRLRHFSRELLCFLY